ncbi:ribosome binding protein, putative [Babesia ovata]|uniref:Ribosome binding protein, putative n=1 Tax=Babesia ovata TaxID=189622 RepID=A0A2H6KCS7_9APIC|nr:ribosome binding protein, putative [Babesia ovata]GBE60806.1 ribosome binding protein, putative [Babesia ovata]
MVPHGIQLSTLKECLQFLMWLNGNSDMQDQVSQNLHYRIRKYFTIDKLTLPNVKAALSDFLEKSSAFYMRLCYKPQPWEYKRERPDQICNALLECMPKFLAVMYFLWYNVDPTFSQLDGGGWKQNWPGALTGAWWWNRHWGGDLDKYLYAESGDTKHGVIPGGFTSGDQVKYSSLGSGYYQGYAMADDIDKIVSKGQHHDFFRDVFVTSVLSTDHGTATPNTANALRLVRVLCQIVEDEKQGDGGELKSALERGLRMITTKNSICWEDLKRHCDHLTKQFKTKLFAQRHFDHTGQGMDTKYLDTKEFASKTADWLRGNLTFVRRNLSEIKIDSSLNNHLGEYFTTNLFPFGFTLYNGTRFQMTPNDVQNLRKDWRDVIEEFRRGSDNDLDKLRDILSGTYQGKCEKQEPPTPKAEGAQNQGKKVEGGQNQKTSPPPPSPSQPPPLSPDQGSTRFPRPPASQDVKSSAATPSPGDQGGTGPVGPKGDKGNPGQQGPSGATGSQGATDAVTPHPSPAPGSSSNQDVHVQQVVQPPPQGSVVLQASPPQPPAPPLPGSSGHPPKPGGPGAGPPAGAAPSLNPGSPQAAVPPRIPSVTGSNTETTGGQGTAKNAGQNVGNGPTQPTSQSSDHGSSGGGTAPGATGPGSGGGSPPAKKCKDSNFSTLWTSPTDYCVPKRTFRKPHPFKFKNPKALDIIHEQTKNYSQPTPHNVDPQDNHIAPPKT